MLSSRPTLLRSSAPLALGQARPLNGVFARALVLGLLALAVLQLVWAVAMVGYPGQLEYGEAIVYDVAERVTRGEPLYQPLDRPPHLGAAYSPLYYWLAGTLRAVVGDGFWPGRLVSLVATSISTGLVWRLAAGRSGSRRAGWLAALLFLALGFPAQAPWTAVFRVDPLGVALSLGCLSLLAGGQSWRRVALAALLASLALLTKQTLFAAGLAGAVWLWGRRPALALAFGGLWLGLTAGASLGLELATGAYVANVVGANTNPFHPTAALSNLLYFARFQTGPLLLAAGYLAGQRLSGSRLRDDLLGLYWLATLAPLLGLAKVGAAHNYWLELAAASAVLASLALGAWRWPRLARPELLLAVSVVGALATLAQAFVPLTTTLWPDGERSALLGHVVERVRREPGAVLADPADVLVLADRRIELEPYIYSIFATQDRWDPAPLRERICSGEVRLLVLGYPIEAPGPLTNGDDPHWPPAIMEALRQRMALEERVGRWFLYVPRSGADRTGCATA